ncbi:MAG TPA: fucose isomerase [Fastidiosipila sp.]|nr:fucose isomerase [Fastidiosipila sp.]
MLKGISPLISPDLLHVLMSMGHGDTIVIADGNFPGASIAARSGAKLIRLDGQGTAPLLKAILELFPLDAYTELPVVVMAKEPRDKDLELPIIDEYKFLVRQVDERGEALVGELSRQGFYDAAENAYAIVQTGETAIYANVMLVKGVV